MSTGDSSVADPAAPATATQENARAPEPAVHGDIAALVATVAQLAETVRAMTTSSSSSSGRGIVNYNVEPAWNHGWQNNPEVPVQAQLPLPVPLPVQDQRPAEQGGGEQWTWPNGWSTDSWPPSSQSWHWQTGGGWSQSSSKPSGPVKADCSDPPAWPGWAHFRLAQGCGPLEQQPRVSLPRRADKVMKLFDWELQSKPEHLSDDVLQSTDGVIRIFEVMDRFSGERESDDMRRATRVALFEYSRRRDETLSMFVGRREQQYAQAEDFRVVLLSPVKALLLKEGAGLCAQGEQNLRTLKSARLHFDVVSKALRDLDTHRERLMAPPGRASNSFPELATDATAPVFATVDGIEDAVDEEITSDFENEILAEIDAMNLPEEDIIMTYAAVLGQRCKTWSENKALKRAIATDRQFQFGARRELLDSSNSPAPSSSSASRKGKGRGGTRVPIDKLKLITKCFNCGEKCHWQRECPKPKKPVPPPGGLVGFVSSLTDELPAAESSATLAFVGAILDDGWDDPSGAVHPCLGFTGLATILCTLTFLALRGGSALADTAAGQAILGLQALSTWEERLRLAGLRAIRVRRSLPRAHGIGGDGKVQEVALILVVLSGSGGSHNGVIEFVVLDQDVPPLLPVDLLEQLGSSICLSTNWIHFERLGVCVPISRD